MNEAGVVRGGRRVLVGANLVLPPGSLTAVVGPEATTLLDLAAGLAPAEGSVRFDGVDVRRLGEDVLASSVAVVTARPFLTPGSVRDNVTLGATCDDAELAEALRIAGLTLTDDPAAHRLQVGLARAVLRRPRLLVLDAPELDPQVPANLAGTGLTVLAATTRPGPYADQIAVLTAGKLTVLNRDDPEYRRLTGSTAEPVGAVAH
ncbi:ATP-binding cassette domain-containing protein [Actinoplanes sp. TRM 88003]|uniref:ATP-binding cassette domain-containing protein n=1 Tax=Paractinoplanes aksuensis TaxID=2939490 RepID=A0ABT1DEM0_9ACTN|nr:ATP-binding cassette domain-containing protein [Actinoplanes aksuensis]MCO8269255.1 ATP-binding cassette domain-containing protein [Actinoplanes aksuensis]